MVNIAVINSTKAYLLGNDSLQLLQRPSSKKYPKTGILSFILIGSLQEKHCDPGLITLIFFGLIIGLGLGLLITKTRLGVQIRAGENDREMVSALGVNISKLYTFVFALGAALAGLAGALVGAIQSVEVGMGEPVLILAFVVIVIGGIGSIKGALIGSILVGLTDTLGGIFLPKFFSLFMDLATATNVGSSIASMSIYILMSIVLVWRPTGLFGQKV